MHHNKILEYLKNLTLDELNGYTLDVEQLALKIQKDVITPKNIQIHPTDLRQYLQKIIPNASFLAARLQSFEIDQISASELKILKPALDMPEQSILLSAHDALTLTGELRYSPMSYNFGVNQHAFLLSANNAKSLLKIMNYTINPHAEKLTPAHAELNKLRLALTELEHRHFFRCSLNAPGPYTFNSEHLDQLVQCLFDAQRSSETLLSAQQLWTLSQHLTTTENQRLFGVDRINLTDDVTLNNVSWDEVIRLADKYNVHFRLEPYQYLRYVRQLKLGQAFELNDMALSKASGFSVNSLQTASQYIAYCVQNTGPFMKVFSLLSGGGLLNWSVAMQRAAYMPFLALIGLFSAKQTYDLESSLELKTRKDTVAAFFKTTQTRHHNKEQTLRLQEIQAQFPINRTPYLHNGKISYYLYLKALLRLHHITIPDYLSSNEAEFLDSGRERELLFDLIQSMVNTPNLISSHPTLQALMDPLKAQHKNFSEHSKQVTAHSRYNPKGHVVNARPIQLQWLLLSLWWNKHYQAIQPFVNPTVSSVLCTGLLLFILTLFTTATSYLIAGTVMFSLLGALVWGMTYACDQNKKNMVTISERNFALDNKVHLESELVRQHQQLCETINQFIREQQNEPKKAPPTPSTRQRLLSAQQRIELLEAENAQLKKGLLSQSLVTQFAHPVGDQNTPPTNCKKNLESAFHPATITRDH